MADITPRTANRIAHLAEAREKAAAANAARKTGPKKQVRIAAAFDEDIELEEAEVRGAARRDLSSILGKVGQVDKTSLALCSDASCPAGELHSRE